MASRNLTLALSFSALLLFHTFCAATASQKLNLEAQAEEEEEDLSFLEADDHESSTDQLHESAIDHLGDCGEDGDAGEDGDDGSFQYPAVEEKDVVVLKKENLSAFVGKNRYVMVEFYAPWCGHCQAMAPGYAAAASELKGEVALAKVDATVESELAEEFQVEAFPTLFFFIDGARKLYQGQRNKDDIVAWIKKQTGPGVHNISTTADAENILSVENKVVLGFLDSLVGGESKELAAASKLDDDDINFYQTNNPDVAQLFNIDPEAKRPVLVLLKREDEKQSFFEGRFKKSAIRDFVLANKLPLVAPFTKENARLIFQHPIKKQVLLFTTSNDTNEFLPIFQEAAKLFKGKLVFVNIEIDGEVGLAATHYFGVTGDGPHVVGHEAYDEPRKYIFEGDITSEAIKDFGKSFIGGKLKPYYKSDPIPQTNDGDVKIVVGHNFDEIVLDESKDVLLEIYAPWCRHCQELEPTYNKLAKFVRGIDSLLIAKMDGTTNEHPKAMVQGFPALLFFPAGKKSSDPIEVETDRKAVSLYKFIKENASIPFKTPRRDEAVMPEEKSRKEEQKESQRDDLKDEL